jgi:hypothetical protein
LFSTNLAAAPGGLIFAFSVELAGGVGAFELMLYDTSKTDNSTSLSVADEIGISEYVVVR